MNPNREIRGLLEARTSDGRDASVITEALFTKIITCLRRDARFAGISRFEFELLLADLRRDTEQQLFHAIAQHIHLDDARYAVDQVLVGEDTS
jgi:hypothetical protein